MHWVLRFIILGSALGTEACVAPDSSTGTSGAAPRMDASETTPRAAGTSADVAIAKLALRFPDAKLLDDEKFVETIQNHSFRYREVGSELIIERPAEAFFENGRYSAGHRVMFQGSYSFSHGILSIKCSDCPESFLGLARERIVFGYQGRAMMANVDGEGAVIELIPHN